MLDFQKFWLKINRNCERNYLSQNLIALSMIPLFLGKQQMNLYEYVLSKSNNIEARGVTV